MPVKRAHIIDELQNIAPALTGINHRNVFSVPDGYFEVHFLETVKQVGITNRMTYSAPMEYFDELSARIYTRISEQQLPAATLPMHAPDGYFDTLSTRILEQTKAGDTKVIPFPRRFSIIRYAAAAIVVGIIGLAAFQFMQPKQNKAHLIMASANEIIQKGNYEEVFESLDETEIIEYLSASGEDINSAIIANASTEAELPDVVDYLIDDNTLDDFLKELDIPNIN
jgi:hypothetical protein